jgi:hypothetical protein
MYILFLIFITVIILILYFYGGGDGISKMVSIKELNLRELKVAVESVLRGELLEEVRDSKFLVKNYDTLDLPVGLLCNYNNFASLLRFSDIYTACRIWQLGTVYERDYKVAGNILIFPFGKKICVETDLKRHELVGDYYIIEQEDTDVTIKNCESEPVNILELFQPRSDLFSEDGKPYYPYLCCFSAMNDTDILKTNAKFTDTKNRLNKRQELLKKIDGCVYLELDADPLSFSSYNWVGREDYPEGPFDYTMNEIISMIENGERIVNKYGTVVAEAGAPINICINERPGVDYTDILERLSISGRFGDYEAI